jgi:SP family galactose:H+ symporter-like MFS transporter
MFSRQSIYFIAFASAISGLLFGYDAGIISGAMLFIKQTFVVSDAQVGMIVSAVPLGALFSAIAIGKISDLIGRKKILIATAVFFATGSLLCGLTSTIEALIIGRFLLGLAVGMSSSSAPMYIAEMTEEKNRGALVTFYLIAVNSGIFISYLVNYVFAPLGEWRDMLMLGVAPAVALGICALLLPESPRWLMLKGKVDQAFIILKKIHGEIKAHKEMAEISQIITQEKVSLLTLLRPNFLRIILLGIMVSVFTQAVGINAIIYYAPTIFQKTGFSQATISILATVGIGLAVTLAAIGAAMFIDKVGRRKLLLSGLAGIILSLLIITSAFCFVKNSQTLGWIVLMGSVLFVLCQGLSVGPACFLIPAEIFPAKIRGTGMGISIAFNWLTNTVVAFLFPMVLDRYGATSSFGIFLIISIIGWILFYRYVPETRHISLEKIELNLLAGIKTRYLGRILA